MAIRAFDILYHVVGIIHFLQDASAVLRDETCCCYLRFYLLSAYVYRRTSIILLWWKVCISSRPSFDTLLYMASIEENKCRQIWCVIPVLGWDFTLPQILLY